MKFFLPLLLVATALATPLIRSYNVKTMMNGDGSGSIEVTAGDKDWSMTWDELTDDVRTEVSIFLFSETF